MQVAMKAIVLRSFGGPESFELSDVPKPVPLSALVERRQLKPYVGAVYSLAEIPLAHARLESPRSGVQGKIANAVDSDP